MDKRLTCCLESYGGGYCRYQVKIGTLEPGAGMFGGLALVNLEPVDGAVLETKGPAEDRALRELEDLWAERLGVEVL